MKIYSIILFSLFAVAACKKTEPAQPQASSEKNITSFAFKSANNPGSNLSADVYAQISHDSILITLPDSVKISNLIPDIKFYGKSINPPTNTAQDFTKPVIYIVTAEDGSKKSFPVKIKQLSGSKSITAFAFLTADNKTLKHDVTGTILHDTIQVTLPAGVATGSLIPSITYTGESINPANHTPADFSVPVNYTVTAADGSTKDYVVIITIQQYIYFGSTDGYVYKLDGSGNLVWKFKTALAGGVTSPVLDNGMVYAGSADRSMYAIDATTGKQKWIQYNHGSICAYPAAAAGKVYIITSDRELIAYDGNTGNITWRQQHYDVTGNPTVYKNEIYTGDVNSAALTFDATTGNFAWGVGVGVTQHNAAVADGMVFNGGEYYRCYAADAITGVQKWIVAGQGKVPTGSPTVWNHMVIVGVSDYNLYAYSEDDGSVIWATSATGFFESGVAENNILYINNNNGHLYALDAATGATIWSYTGLAGNVDCTVANGMLYGAGADGYLYALNARSGTVAWKFKPGGSIGAAPCVQDADGNVYYCGASGEHN